MSVTFADRLLRPRYVVIGALIVVAIGLYPPVYAAVRPPTIAFTNEVGTLVTGEGELTVDWYPSPADLYEIMVRRWSADGTARILGSGRTYFADGDELVLVGNDFVMVCPSVDGDGGRRYLFGAVGARPWSGRRPAIDIVSYFGPPANGARFANGLYLIAFEPGQIAPDASIELLRTNAFYRLQGSTFDDALRLGRTQDSGCVVA